MTSSRTILYVASEVSPFAKTGGLADVAYALPRALKNAGHDIRVFMPKYGHIDDKKFVLRDVIRLKDMKVPHQKDHVAVNIKSAFLPESKVQIYFLDYPPYFDRQELYVDPETGTDYDDNAARFTLFARAALEMLKQLHWQPEIIHCNDWQTGLIPVYLKTLYRDVKYFQKCRTLLTIHNFAYSGTFPTSMLKVTGLDNDLNNGAAALQFFDRISFLKGGLCLADALNTVSKTYAAEAKEIPEIGCGMESVLQKRKRHFTGLINGVEYDVWNPETDSLIPENYTMRSLEKKAENKKALCEYFGIPFSLEQPVIASVSRLVYQKGFDLIAESIPRMIRLKAQYIVLGRGEKKVEQELIRQQKANPGNVHIRLEFNDELAHLIEAGADLFLMPSRYEPCGLNQLYSMKYGTIPIVRKTGGLADTVIDYDTNPEKGYGFVFEKYKSSDLNKALSRSVKAFRNKKLWRRIMIRAMKKDYSWESTSKAYERLYQKLSI